MIPGWLKLVGAFVKQFWPILAAIALLVAVSALHAAAKQRAFERGAASVQSKWDQEKADARVAHAVSVGFSRATVDQARADSAAAQQDTRADTKAALGRIEDAIQEFGDDLARRGCPVDVPVGVQDEGRKAVAAARAAGS